MANILRGIGKITNSAGQTFEWELTDPTAGQGLIYQDGKWINSGNFASDTGTVSTMDPITGVEYLVIAGGGGGGAANRGGGGGSGGYRSSVSGEFSGGGNPAESPLTLTSTYTVIIGAGGATHPYSTDHTGLFAGENGGDSVFGDISTVGGGGGGYGDVGGVGQDPKSGGSGGGGWYGSPFGASNISEQGFAGGIGGTSQPYGGGGGGAGEAGMAYNDASNPCKGGNGLASSITGSSVYRAGGGGSGTYPGQSGPVSASGGLGGGGSGGNSSGTYNAAPHNGTVNTGSGGGSGGSGGSGVVILAYPKESQKLPYIDGNLAYNYSQRPSDQAHVYEFVDGAGQISATEADPAFYSKELENACLFDGSSYLSRTPTVAGNRKTWTFSAWVKWSVGQNGTIFHQYDGAAGNRGIIYFQSDYTLQANSGGSGSDINKIVTSSLYRDSSAWYHFLVANDTTQSTASDRIKLWINGVEILDGKSPAGQNTDGLCNSANLMEIGHHGGGKFNGYMANIQFIDGQALDANSFGTYREGVWIPKQYGTGDTANAQAEYGTNGFHLDFSNAGNLGQDVSGRGNDWTVN